MKYKIAKGTRDLSPEDKIAKNDIVRTLKKMFELYGFSPMETPILERYDTLSAKYAGGEEILKETFQLRDQGGRKLGLRYDQTVPLSRFISENPNIKMPFKRYISGQVFRDGPIKSGRYREFWQGDADIIGCKSIKAEVELLTLTSKFFKELNLDVVIRLNSRKILDAILTILNIPEKDKMEFILSLDKLGKVRAKGVREDLKRKGIEDYNQMTPLLSTARMKSLDQLKNYIKNVFKQQNKIFENTKFEEGFREIGEILDYLKKLNIRNVVFDGTLARGLSYYTGPIYEVFLKKSDIALCAGGRFDNLINANKDYPAVGVSFGIDRILDIVNVKRKIKQKTTTQVYIIPIKTFENSLRFLKRLRKEGINTEIDLLDKGISKNLDYANSLGIPYVILVGFEELKKKKIRLKDMKTGKERLLSIRSAIRNLKLKV